MKHADWKTLFLKRDPQSAPESLLPAFEYDGKSFDPEIWRHTWRDKGCNRSEVEFLSPDGRLKFLLDIRVYDDYDAVYYIPYFISICGIPSGIIADFQALSWRSRTVRNPNLGHGGESSPVFLRRNYGTKSNCLDFVARNVPLSSGGCPNMRGEHKVVMQADEGRPSAEWLPFWAADFAPDDGVIIGLGWSGAWQAEIELEREGIFRMEAGMLETHFRVEPYETLRNIGVLVCFRNGIGVTEGQNRFRNLLIEHFAVRNHWPEERPVLPVVQPVFGGISTRTHLDFLRMYEKYHYPCELIGIDAGWYGYGYHADVFTLTWARETGNWRVNDAHPNGLRPITDEISRMGAKSYLWTEFERACPYTDLVAEHPEWFVDDGDLMLNLGNPEALNWLIDFTIHFFHENNLYQMQQDFNFNTLSHWRKQDTPERIGVSEMKYIAGLYTYWDALLAAEPAITINHCASGGRRIDLEAVQRGFTFWRSDAQCFPDNDPLQNQIQHFYLSQWYPFHSGGIWVKQNPSDEYSFFSAAATGISDCTFIYHHQVPSETEWDYADHARLLREAVRLRPYFLGNYYPLTGEPERRENWCAFQYALPDGSGGILIAFRREESPEADMYFQLRELDPDAEYQVEFYRGNTATSMSGKQLRWQHIELAPRSFEILTYARKESSRIS